jgi:hypothetical protein
MAAVSPAHPKPRITVSRISVIFFPVLILDGFARLGGVWAVLMPEGGASGAKARIILCIIGPAEAVPSLQSHMVDSFRSTLMQDLSKAPSYGTRANFMPFTPR